MVVRPKHVADHLNEIVNNYWNRVALDGNPWTWSNTRNRMETPKFIDSHVNFRCIYFHMKMLVLPKHVADNLNKIVSNHWNNVALDGNPWTWFSSFVEVDERFISNIHTRAWILLFECDVKSTSTGKFQGKSRRTFPRVTFRPCSESCQQYNDHWLVRED
jgi:hypothetical protein